MQAYILWTAKRVWALGPRDFRFLPISLFYHSFYPVSGNSVPLSADYESGRVTMSKQTTTEALLSHENGNTSADRLNLPGYDIAEYIVTDADGNTLSIKRNAWLDLSNS